MQVPSLSLSRCITSRELKIQIIDSLFKFCRLNQAVMAHTFNPSTWEAKAGWVPSQGNLAKSFIVIFTPSLWICFVSYNVIITRNTYIYTFTNLIPDNSHLFPHLSLNLALLLSFRSPKLPRIFCASKLLYWILLVRTVLPNLAGTLILLIQFTM